MASVTQGKASSSSLDPYVWKIAAVVLFGPLMSSLDSTVVNVSLATLAQELHTSFDVIQWITTGYLLALALTLPMSGWLVDRFGSKRVYLACFTAFTLTSLLCASAHSADSLIVFRILQGMAAGLLAPMAQMMIARVAGIYMARVMAIMVMPVLLGPILGPVIAGAILQSASWRWIFLINLPIGVLATTLALFILPKDRDDLVPRRFDLPGFVLLAPGLVFFLYGLESLEAKGASPVASSWLMSFAALLVLSFVWHSLRKGKSALIDVRLFKSPVFSAAAATQFLSNAISFGGQLILPLYLLTARHMSPRQTGIVLASAGFGMLCTYPFVGALTERLGPRTMSGGGALIALLATLPFAFLGHIELPAELLAASLFLRGVGLSSINIPSMASAYTSAPKEVLPVATTAINIVQRLGGPVGTAILGIFLHAKLAHSSQSGLITSAFAATFALLCFVHALSLFSSLLLPRGVRQINRSTKMQESPV